MGNRFVLMILAGWVLIGALGTGYLYRDAAAGGFSGTFRAFDKEENRSIILDAADALMRRSQVAQAFFLANKSGTILSSIYEAGRLSTERYRSLLAALRKGESGSFTGHRVEKISLQHFDIIAVSADKLSFSRFLEIHSGRTDLRIAAGIWFSVAALLFFGVFAGFIQNRAPVTAALAAAVAATGKKKPAQPAAESPKEAEPSEIRAAGDELKQLSDAVFERHPYLVFIYYRHENGMWHGVFERKGEIVVRGSSVMSPPDFLKSIRPEDTWAAPVLSSDGLAGLFPAASGGRNAGAFLIRGRQKLTPDSASAILRAVNTHSRDIIHELAFSAAKSDAETGLLTRPYLLNSIREKTLAKARFGVLVISIPDWQKYLPGHYRTWSDRIRFLLGNTLAADTGIGVLGPGRYGILFSLEDQLLPVSMLGELCEKIRRLTVDAFHAGISGALVMKTPQISDPEDFLGRLKYAAGVAEKNRTFGVEFRTEKQSGVA